MPDSGADGPLEVAVEPRSDQYDPDDDGWRDQVATLYEDLYAHVDTFRRGRPDPGTKGTIDQVIIALGSAEGFHAVADCFRAWLSRDRDRRIDLSWDEDGVQHSVTLTGKAVDGQTVREIARAMDRMGGPPWPAGTEPS